MKGRLRSFLFLWVGVGVVLPVSPAVAAGKGSYLGAKVDQFTGSNGSSLTGSYGYGARFEGTKGNGAFRALAGGDFTYSNALIRFSSGERNARFMGGAFTVGGMWIPLGDQRISPFLRVAGGLGVGYLQIESPPTGVNEIGTSLTYQYGVGFGVQIPWSSSRQIRLTVDYLQSRALNLAETSGFDLSSLSFGFGISY